MTTPCLRRGAAGLRDILLILIIIGLGGLIAPTNPQLIAGRLGIWLKRVSAALILVTIAFGVAMFISRPDAIFAVAP